MKSRPVVPAFIIPPASAAFGQRQNIILPNKKQNPSLVCDTMLYFIVLAVLLHIERNVMDYVSSLTLPVSYYNDVSAERSK